MKTINFANTCASFFDAENSKMRLTAYGIVQ